MSFKSGRRDSPAPAAVEVPAERAVSGVIERVTYHNDETGFAVLKVKVTGRKGLATLLGKIASVAPGEKIEATGLWIADPARGLQFKAETLTTAPPASASGIERYLASGVVRGVGAQTARKLVAAFGRETLQVLDTAPERLSEVAGLSAERIRLIRQGWVRQQGARDTAVFLAEHGLGPARAAAVRKVLGPEAIDLIKEDPYRLAREVKGVDFRTADQLAMALGRPREDPARLAAGILASLQRGAADGHCGLPIGILFEAAGQLLGIDIEALESAAAAMLRAKTIIADTIGGEASFFLPRLWNAEREIAEHLKLRAGETPSWPQKDLSAKIDAAAKASQRSLSADQHDAVKLALGRKAAVITGGPGVGKTTVIDTIARVLKAEDLKIALCAPTGRAAKRMSEATGLEAKTIHRLLEIDPVSGLFRRAKAHPLGADLVIADEASMIDVELLHALLQALPQKASLLLVGDADQLPSVGPGRILADIIASQALPVARLAQVFRQAQTSRIIAAAHAVNQGQIPEGAKGPEDGDFFLVEMASAEDGVAKVIEIVTQRLPRRWDIDPARDIQVLTPMNKGSLGAANLTEKLRAVLNANRAGEVVREWGRFAPGDKVMQTDNDYEKDIFNGDIGFVRRTDPEAGLVMVSFDGREVAYASDELASLVPAYATTIHKAQGSEYPAVVVVLAMAHRPMLARNLLYTALTRGQRLVVLICERQALRMAAANAMGRPRWTKLQERLRDESAVPAKGGAP